MRCAVHNDREAVGLCIGCGAGVCTACRVAIAGTYTVILLTGLALRGVTLLLSPSALIATRHLTRQRAFSVASGVLFLIAAHMIILPLPFNAVAMLSPSGYYYLQYFASYYGIISIACVVEPACILGAILMYRSRPPK